MVQPLIYPEKKQNIQVKKRRKIDKSRVENPDRLFDLREIKKIR